MQMTVQELLERIERESVDAGNETIVIEKMEIGDYVRQGDVYLFRVNLPSGGLIHVRDLLPVALHYTIDATIGAWTKPWPHRNLVPGSTRGASHCAEAPAKVFLTDAHHALVGPVVESSEPWLYSHDQHSNYLMPTGQFLVTYQRDLRAEEIARVMD